MRTSVAKFKASGPAIAALLVLSAGSLHATGYTWVGGTGDTTVGASYIGGSAPDWSQGSPDSIYFRCSDEAGWTGDLSCAIFPASYYLQTVVLNAMTTVVDNRDKAAVTLEGPSGGGTLHMSSAAQFNVPSGRNLTIRNLRIVRDNPAGSETTAVTLRDKSKLTFGPGSSLATTSTSEFFYVTPGSSLTIDGGDVSLAVINMTAPCTFNMRSGRLQVPALPNHAGLSFTGGEIVNVNGFSAYYALPKSEEATLTVLNSSVTALDLRGVPDGVAIPWRGTVNATNSTGTAIIPNFSGTIYGGGKLRVGEVYMFSNPYELDIQLSEIALSRGMRINVETGTVLNFRGDTTFRAYGGNMSMSLADNATYRARMFGKTTFSTADLFSGVARDISVRYVDWPIRSSLAVEGPGKVGLRYYNVNDGVSSMCIRHGSFSLGEGSTFEMETANPYRGRIRTQNFTMGANSTLRLGQYISGEEIPEVIGNVSAAAGSRLVAVNTPAYSTTLPVARFIALDDEAVLPEYETPADLPETHSVQRVGGCIFIAPKDGISVASTGIGNWSGNGTTGNWSDSDNWAAGSPQWYYRVYLNGTRHLYSTNDISEGAYRGYASLDVNSAAGPFHLSGVEIPIAQAYDGTVNGGGVNNSSAFPAFFEINFSSAKDSFATITKSANAINVFRGGVSVPNGAFVPDGAIVVEGENGAVTARDLVLGPGFYRRTILTVQKGGTVSATAQTATNNAAASLWIAENGTVSIAGDWVWNDNENEHQVDGALNVSGSLGGSAAQGYFGSGVVKVGGTTDDTTAVRIGEGVTISPAGWGAMKLDAVSSAKVGAQADWTYGAASFDVSGLDAQVSFVGDRTITVAAPFVGRDFSLAQQGSGRLVLADGSGSLSNSTVKVEAGALAWTADQTVGKLALEPGAALEFGMKQNGAAACLEVKDGTVDFTDVTLAAMAGAPAVTTLTPVLVTSPDCTVVGAPTVAENMRLRAVGQSDGSTVWLVKEKQGVLMLIR